MAAKKKSVKKRKSPVAKKPVRNKREVRKKKVAVVQKKPAKKVKKSPVRKPAKRPRAPKRPKSKVRKPSIAKAPKRKRPSKQDLLKKKIALALAKLKRKRKIAAKRGWETRRKIAELQRRLDLAEAQAGIVTERYKQFISLDNLPPRMIHETAIEHTARIVKMMRFMGYGADQSYIQIARFAGVQPREVYTMFMYVGNGEFVA